MLVVLLVYHKLAGFELKLRLERSQISPLSNSGRDSKLVILSTVIAIMKPCCVQSIHSHYLWLLLSLNTWLVAVVVVTAIVSEARSLFIRAILHTMRCNYFKWASLLLGSMRF